MRPRRNRNNWLVMVPFDIREAMTIVAEAKFFGKARNTIRLWAERYGIGRMVDNGSLAHGKCSIPERALLGADLHLNYVGLVSPTIKQCARLVGVCVPYVAPAVAIADDQAARAAVLAGDCPFLDAAKAAAPETLAEHFARTSPSEWLEGGTRDWSRHPVGLHDFAVDLRGNRQ